MRILMLTDLFPPVMGGAEQYVQRLSRELVRRGHAVSVVTQARPDRPSFAIEGGVRVHRVRAGTQSLPWLFSNAERPFSPPAPDPSLMWQLRRVLADEQPDVVHAHNWLVHSFVPLKAASGAPLLLTLHDYSLRCGKKSFMYHDQPCSGPALGKCLECAVDHYGAARGIPTLLANWGFGASERAAVDLFLPVSEAVARGSGLPGSGLPYRVIPNFVDDSASDSIDDDFPGLRDLPKGPFILFVGALSKHKGVEVLLRAYTQMSSAPPLVLIGARWQEATFDLPPNVYTFENWPNTAVLAAWRRCAFGVVPSIWPDPCPTVALEAMAAGRPVVGSAIGGLPDLVADGETGLLVPPGDADALRAAMERLVGNRYLCAQMGQAAGERVARFRAGPVVDQVEAVYRLVRSGQCRAA